MFHHIAVSSKSSHRLLESLAVAHFDELLARFFYSPDEEVGAFLEVAPLADDTSSAAAEEAPHQFLSFQLEGETYAVPIDVVREIMKVPAMTEVPRTDRRIIGVMNVRGEMLPAVDVKAHLKLTEKPLSLRNHRFPRSSRIVLVRDEQGDFGITVDSVIGVTRFRPSTVETPPPLISESRGVRGLARVRGELIIVLDTAELLQ